MGIVQNFNGVGLRVPKAYSVTNVNNANGAQLNSVDTLFLVGEATSGKPGSIEGITSFTAENISALVAKYGSGPIVDCALAAVRPSTQQGIGGAGKILVWKTNASTDATVTVNETTNTNPLFTFSDLGWGVGGDLLSVTITNGDTAKQKNVTINQLGGSAESLGENPATAVLSIDYTGNGSAATASITGASYSNTTLATSLTGQSDGSVNLSIPLKNYTILQLVNYINTQTGYVAVLLDSTKASRPATDLDPIASTNIHAVVVSLYRLQQELLTVISSSKRVSAALATTPVPGVPFNATNAFLTGGVLGASVNSDFATGLAKSLSQTYSDVLACISQDATADISAGFTDPSSTYTIASVLSSLSSHLNLRESLQNQKEAQGWAGFRSSTKATAYSTAQTLNQPFLQMCIQDVLVNDVNANSTWKYPHVQAALMAGIRLGTPVGEPLTHKFLNCQGIGHFVTASTGLSAGDFLPGVDSNPAIDAGITFAEQITSGFRIVVDNTTYGTDSSFVWNRGSVVEAAIFIAQTIRQTAEDAFVGKKISNGAAISVKTMITNKLLELNKPDVNITTASKGAPNGFDPSTFIVTVAGSTCSVQVAVVPVQGGDFVFITFTLDNIQQSA